MITPLPIADPLTISSLYTPMERAVLSAYLDLPDPSPDDLRSVDASRPVGPRWSEAKDGIGPRLSAHDNTDLMTENAAARICLESVGRHLPQWAVVQDGVVTLGRPRRRRARRQRVLSPLHLFTINWGDSGPGFSWPDAYYVTWLQGYDVSIVTASADSPDAIGYCDTAVGWFIGPISYREAALCIAQHWWSLKACGQERWAYLFDTGALDQTTANGIADAVWRAEREQ